jgi:hypothetical protein
MSIERVAYVSHRGKRILIIDISNGRGPEISQVIGQAKPLIRGSDRASVLTVTIVTDVNVKEVPMDELIDFVKGNKPYVKAAAVVGISQLAGAMLATTRILTGRQLKAFDSQQEALDWLVGVP